MKAETVLGEVDMSTVIRIFQQFGVDQKEGKESYQGAEIGGEKGGYV